MLLPLVVDASLLLSLQVRVDANTTTDSAGRKGHQVSVQVGGSARGDRERRRIPVTAQHLATAFRNHAARELLGRARVARFRQDSALVSYDVMAYQRVSAGLSVSRIGRERLLFRTENAARVQWHRDVGAWVEVKGARSVAPSLDDDSRKDIDRDVSNETGGMVLLPYRPGQETLFIGSGIVEAEVDDQELVHPLAEGAEAYYTYRAADSASIRLPGGALVRIREMEVRPREPKWNLVVGSLWFDADRGQLVRAAYRLATPLDVWAMVDEEAKRDGDEDDVPAFVKGLTSPVRGQIRAIAVEYGLHAGRFWLPRLQYAEGDMQAGFLRVPFKMELSYRYASVNARDSLPPIRVVDRPNLDSLSDSARDRWRDSVSKARRAVRDSVDQGLKPRNWDCDAQGMRTVTRTRGRGDHRIRIATRVPCDAERLVSSPELPPSIYDAGEELFGAKEREELVSQAIAMGMQPVWAPQRPRFETGLRYLRYNRVEGVSVGAKVDQQLGAGYAASVSATLGVADLEPNAIIELQRTDLTRTLRVRGYNQLVSASDWGNPLSFGSSISAVLFGRDEGFYFRSSGAELSGSRLRPSGAPWIEWRLFGERQRGAVRETSWSAFGEIETPDLPVNAGQFAGGGLRLATSRGLNPRGFRLFTDMRLESAAGDTGRTIGYGRGAVEATATRGIGPLASALTVAAGASVGELPVQRQWYLGGTHTVRGQRPGTASGSAFWLARGEVGLERKFARPAVFADIGWAGDRRVWRESVQPLSGAGAGVSILDGVVRFDVARGIKPRAEWRVDLYLEAKF